MEKRPSDVVREEVLERLQSRSDFLKMAGAAGLGAAVGSNVLLREAFGAVDRSAFDIHDLRFQIESDYRPFDVISDNFIEHSDGFDRSQGFYDRLAPEPENNRGNVTIGNGRLRVSGDGAAFLPYSGPTSPRGLHTRRWS